MFCGGDYILSLWDYIMADTFKEISSSYFRRYASLHPETWNEIIGMDIIHVKWGRCTIEKIEGGGSRLRVGGHHIAIGGFTDDSFSGLVVSSDLADTIMAYIKRRDELDEQEWAEQETKRLLEEEEAERIEREKKQLEATRLAKIKEEAENRRRLELERQATLERERRNQKQKRAQSIRSYCKERGISRLFHFTRIENLSSILEHGLLGRQQLGNLHLSTPPKTNDNDRFDGFPDALCLSISYPNYKMFYKLSMDNQGQWVILLLDSYILWEFDCAFFETNAASLIVRNMDISHRKEYSSFVNLFGDRPGIKRQDIPLSDQYTTDPQAEVLVFEPIPPEYFISVYFFDETAKQNWLRQTRICRYPPKRLIANPGYFRPRHDYRFWASNKKLGVPHDMPELPYSSEAEEGFIPF